ncbi:MAG: hypothetical protein KF729_08260 [Sandaracinaceae bacterium]|nr:hypothetical protein [Sandaracinaceae bacterium]
MEARADRRAVLGWLLATAGCGAALALVALAAPHLPAVHPYASGTLAFACVGAEVLAVAALAPPLRARALAGLAIPLGALVAVALVGDALGRLPASVAVTVALLAAGTLVGAVVGRAIEDAGHLAVVAIVSAAVDAYSVLSPSGPTAQIVQIEAAVDVLLLPWPILGTPRIEPVLGVGDVAFAAIYAVASRRHDLPMKRTIAALAVGLAVTLAVVLATGAGTPALPFLGAAILVAHPRARRLRPEDRRKAWIGIAVLLAALGALVLLR